MTQSNNDIEELEELLTELEGQEAQLVRPYSEDDDAVTQLMDAPLGDQEWMVQVTALDRRMMSTDQVQSELRAGKLSSRTLVWRGGMDDWLPIARIDSLSQGGASPGGMPMAALSASPSSGRLGAPAPLPAPPMWSTSPSVAPLPPPPVAPAKLSAIPSSGLPPAAAAPLPPPPSQPSLPRAASASLPPPPPVASSQGNTSRPVAIDFSEMVEDTSSPLRGKRALMALSAVAILAVFISVYALSSKSEGSATAASTEQPRAVSALQPASAEKKSESMAAAALAKPAEPSPAATPAPKPAESELAANEASASNGSAARTTAPARYSPRSEYRRRSRSGSSERAQDDAESSEASAETPARAAAPARTAAAEEEAPSAEPAAPAGSASDDADSAEAPKSTGKSSNTFNREAAKAALAEAASQAKNCRPAGGPTGSGRVEVHYEPSGRVSNVTISSKFENTTTGSCVRMLFRRAKVPEFTGAPVITVSKSFEIP